jgi:hypothetical protein
MRAGLMWEILSGPGSLDQSRSACDTLASFIQADAAKGQEIRGVPRAGKGARHTSCTRERHGCQADDTSRRTRPHRDAHAGHAGRVISSECCSCYRVASRFMGCGCVANSAQPAAGKSGSGCQFRLRQSSARGRRSNSNAATAAISVTGMLAPITVDALLPVANS